jgi:hypothetical protein
VRGKEAKLGEGCPMVRLSQDRLPIEAKKSLQKVGGNPRKLETLIYPDPVLGLYFLAALLLLKISGSWIVNWNT